MNDKIKHYYRERVKNDYHNNFLWQVGKTVNGKEISRAQVELIIKTIANRLQLDKNDVALDIGCGNGFLTKEISRHVSKITGLELTPELHEIAKQYNSAENVSYINCDALRFSTTEGTNKFTKVYLYEVIQHLDYQDSDALITALNKITTKNAVIFIGGILDAEKKWAFFDTTERRSDYFTGLISGNNPLGTWYHKEFFNCLAKKHNLQAECITQENDLYTCHYRFDCLLRSK